MKLFGFAIVLSFSSLVSVDAQELNKVSNQMYVKAGVEFQNYSNAGYKDLEAGPHKWQTCFSAAIGYEYSKAVDMEVEYKYFPEYTAETTPIWEFANNNGGRYHFFGQSVIRSSIFNFRVNYHVNEDRKTDPIYFIGCFSLAAEPVRNTRIYTFEDSVATISESYTRFLIGPIAGVGVYFDTGIISFQSEISFGARVDLFKDRGFTETSFNFNFSPIIHF